jgi:hypothetical protein
MLNEKLKKRMVRDRPVTSITLRCCRRSKIDPFLKVLPIQI